MTKAGQLAKMIYTKKHFLCIVPTLSGSHYIQTTKHYRSGFNRLIMNMTKQLVQLQSYHSGGKKGLEVSVNIRVLL